MNQCQRIFRKLGTFPRPSSGHLNHFLRVNCDEGDGSVTGLGKEKTLVQNVNGFNYFSPSFQGQNTTFCAL